MQGGKIMKKDNRQERLKAIKLRYVVFPTECKICGKKHKFEKMWKFKRYYINKEVVNWHFCQDCISSAEEALEEIDTDECVFGIAHVDSFFTFQKKDYTRVNARFD